MAAIETAFKVIETIIDHQADGLTFSQVASNVNLPKSSCHRILNLLVQAGYLFYNPKNKLYFSTLKVSALGAKVVQATDQHRLIRPIMEAMGNESGVACQAGIINGFTGVSVDQVLAPKLKVNFFCSPGQEFPLHCTGLGKALLAHSPEKLVNAVIAAGLPKYTDTTITDEKTFRRELQEVRNSGYARDRQELSLGVLCVAAPIFNYREEVFMAISLNYTPYVEGADPEFFDRMKSIVLRYARFASNAMGYKSKN